MEKIDYFIIRPKVSQKIYMIFFPIQIFQLNQWVTNPKKPFHYSICPNRIMGQKNRIMIILFLLKNADAG